MAPAVKIWRQGGGDAVGPVRSEPRLDDTVDPHLRSLPVRIGVIGRFVPRITVRPRSGSGLRAKLRRIEVEGPHVGAVRGGGIPVVVSGQDDVVPAQRRNVPEQARVGYPRRHRGGEKTRANPGRPPLDPETVSAAKKLIEAGLSSARAAKQPGIGRATAYGLAATMREEASAPLT